MASLHAGFGHEMRFCQSIHCSACKFAHLLSNCKLYLCSKTSTLSQKTQYPQAFAIKSSCRNKNPHLGEVKSYNQIARFQTVLTELMLDLFKVCEAILNSSKSRCCALDRLVGGVVGSGPLMMSVVIGGVVLVGQGAE